MIGGTIVACVRISNYSRKRIAAVFRLVQASATGAVGRLTSADVHDVWPGRRDRYRSHRRSQRLHSRGAPRVPIVLRLPQAALLRAREQYGLPCGMLREAADRPADVARAECHPPMLQCINGPVFKILHPPLNALPLPPPPSALH